MNKKIEITKEKIEIAKIRKTFNNINTGAIVIFEGVVRKFNKGLKVEKINYEAFKEMAEKEIDKIIDEEVRQIKNFNEIYNIYLCHRIGELTVGETSIIVAVCTEHRNESFVLCTKIMDQVKARVPIWKYETTENGAHWIQ
mgnify:FL=1